MKAQKVFERIRFVAGGGGDLPPETDHVSMSNEAGRILCGMLGWRWLSNRTALVDVIAGQDWIELPEDFQALQDVRVRDFANNVIQVTTAAEQNRLRAIGTGIYYIAATVTAMRLPEGSQGVRVNKTGVVPVLTIAPAPDTDSLQSVLCSYQAGWRDLAQDNDEVELPEFMLPLYMEWASEYALGVINREDMDVNQRLQKLQQGALFWQAKRTDMSMQHTVGQLRNGVGSRVRSNIMWHPSWASYDFIP